MMMQTSDSPTAIAHICQYYVAFALLLYCMRNPKQQKAGNTRSRNWYQLSGTRNLHVCRSIWYQFFLVPVSGME